MYPTIGLGGERVPVFRGHEYHFTPDGVADLMRLLSVERGSAARIIVTAESMPPGAVDIDYIWPNTVAVRLPFAEGWSERTAYFMHRWLCCWVLFVAVRMRSEDVAGRCRLWLDDLPGGPGLAFSAGGTANVLIPDPNFLESRGYLGFRRETAERHVAWPQRTAPVFWRGASTGSRRHIPAGSWRDVPRFRLCLMAKAWARPDLFDIGLSSVVQVWDSQEAAEIAAADILRPGVSQLTFGDFRHTIDIDGNSNSWNGLFCKLVLGCTVLKVESPLGHRQWYYDRLIPWKNFVPVSQDMGELLDLAEWLQAAPQEAEAIAAGGRRLADDLTFEAVLDTAVPRIRAVLRP